MILCKLLKLGKYRWVQSCKTIHRIAQIFVSEGQHSAYNRHCDQWIIEVLRCQSADKAHAFLDITLTLSEGMCFF